MNNAEDLEV